MGIIKSLLGLGGRKADYPAAFARDVRELRTVTDEASEWFSKLTGGEIRTGMERHDGIEVAQALESASVRMANWRGLELEKGPLAGVTPQAIADANTAGTRLLAASSAIGDMARFNSARAPEIRQRLADGVQLLQKLERHVQPAVHSTI